MKLVDILAVNLKCWPDHMTHLWISAGNTIYGKNGSFEFEMNGGWDKPEDHRTVSVSRAEWKAAVDALNAPKVVEWDGEGLPPVGSTCEHSTDDNKNDSADGGWKKVKIVGHHQFHNDDYLCAVWVSGTDVSYSSEGEHFRPIRTAEQVAAEEIEAIREFIIYEHRDGGLIGIAKALHESGYRKEPKPCGS